MTQEEVVQEYRKVTTETVIPFVISELVQLKSGSPTMTVN